MGTPEREYSLLGPLRPSDEHEADEEQRTREQRPTAPAFEPDTFDPDVCKEHRLISFQIMRK